MRAILVSVDYADLLAITLSYNRHHFDEVWVVTSNSDRASVDVALKHDCRFFQTDTFYEGGAVFNKWRALEQGLDMMGRWGWLCVMDADVLWPKYLPGPRTGTPMIGSIWITETMKVGQLCSPLRRMWSEFPTVVPRDRPPDAWEMTASGVCMPAEQSWHQFPIHRNVAEWAGYTQIFHATDLVLDSPPWHEIDWKTAGSADSFFQAKWAQENKIRPPWECLHLGPAGENWAGRTSRYVDGTTPEGAKERREYLDKMLRDRRGKSGMDRFKHERL